MIYLFSCSPIFKPYQSTIKVQENSRVPQVIATLEATDRDEGPYGQVSTRNNLPFHSIKILLANWSTSKKCVISHNV